MRLPDGRHHRNHATGHISKILAFSREPLAHDSNCIYDKIFAMGDGRPQVAPTDGNTNEYVGQGLAPAAESKIAAQNLNIYP